MHDLIRLYAAERATDDVSDGEAGLALRRLVDFLVHTAHAADRLINPNRTPVTPEPRLPGIVPVPLPDEGAALAWFAEEYTSLVAAQELAAERGWNRAAWHLAWAMYTFQRRTGRKGDDVAAWQTGLAAAQRLQDSRAELIAQRSLGESYAGIGRHDEAVEHLGRTLAMAKEQGDVEAEASSHRAFAFAHEQRGRTRLALHHAIRTLRLCRAMGEPGHEADALHMVGWFAARLGHHSLARPYLETSLAIARRHADRNAEIEIIDSLGFVAFRAGQLVEARAYYAESLALTRERGYAVHEADVHEHLGDVSAALGDHEQARMEWDAAVRLYEAQLRTISADRVRSRLAAGSPRQQTGHV
jgi:tetratricopeptide (TPR) repeat protein